MVTFEVKVSLTKNRHTEISVTQVGGSTTTKVFPFDWLNLTDEMLWRREVDKIKEALIKKEFNTI